MSKQGAYMTWMEGLSEPIFDVTMDLYRTVENYEEFLVALDRLANPGVVWDADGYPRMEMLE